MRFPNTVEFLLSSIAVAPLTLANPIQPRAQLVDLAQFGTPFHTITLEEAKANAAKNNAAHANLTGSTDSSSSSPSAAAPGTNAAVEQGSTDATAAGSCTAPATRIEWRRLTDDQRTAYAQAVRCLVDLPASGAFAGAGAQNRYEDLVAVHLQMTGSIHGVAQFLPWHRYYVQVLETMLREECAYTGPMTWWDETLDAGNFGGSLVFSSQWFGTAPLKTPDGQGTCITDGVSPVPHPSLLSL
jgi:tyrosinase